MSGYIESVLLDNVELEQKITQDYLMTQPKLLEYIYLIKKYMEKENLKLSYIEEFIEKYFKFDNKIIIDYDTLMLGIKNQTLTKEIVENILTTKPDYNQISKIKLNIRIKKMSDSINNFINKNQNNYIDKTICDFLRIIMVDYNLESDQDPNSTEIEYLQKIYNIYYPNKKINTKSLKNKVAVRYFVDILKLHSILTHKIISSDSEIIKMFLDFLSELYFDRDEYKTIPLDLEKQSNTKNIDINTLFQNTTYQVNMFSFCEKQREPDYKIRSDLVLMKKLLQVGKIFNLIGHDVIIIGSNFKTDENNQGYWENNPNKFDDIIDSIMKEYPKLPFNQINIYIQVDFDVCF